MVLMMRLRLYYI